MLWKLIWGNCAPLTVVAFIWKVVHDRVPLRAELTKCDLVLDSLLCVLCDKEIESVDHLLCHCELRRFDSLRTRLSSAIKALLRCKFSSWL
ncbi:hypothetical protein GQ457_02G014430 [Hibiscus cannabinus]